MLPYIEVTEGSDLAHYLSMVSLAGGYKLLCDYTRNYTLICSKLENNWRFLVTKSEILTFFRPKSVKLRSCRNSVA